MSCLSLARAVQYELQESQGQVRHPGTLLPERPGEKTPAQRSRQLQTLLGAAPHQPTGKMLTPSRRPAFPESSFVVLQVLPQLKHALLVIIICKMIVQVCTV